MAGTNGKGAVNPFLAGLKADAHRCVVAPDGRAYKLRRIRSADLAEHAIAELVGAMDVRQELQRLQAEEKAAGDAWKAEHIPEGERDEWERKQAERAAHTQAMQERALLRTLTKNPKVFEGHARRVDAYVCAGVVAGGTGPDMSEPGIVAEADCSLSPVRFCAEEKDEDLAAGVCWVAAIDQETRAFLCGMISNLSEASQVRPFRGGGGDVASTGHAGEAVSDGPVDGADVGPGSAGSSDPV